MSIDVNGAYAAISDMFADFFDTVGISPPTPEDFQQALAPILESEAGATRMSADDDRGRERDSNRSDRDSRDPDADLVMQRSMAGNVAFYDQFKAEMRRRLSAKKGKGPRRRK